jgi:hypothetical protein
MQVFSPNRQAVGYPFLFAPNHPQLFSLQENEKYRKLMLKKQKR